VSAPDRYALRRQRPADRRQPLRAPGQDLPSEKWRPVVGFDGYDVSNMGRVRSRRFTGGEVAPRMLTPSRLAPSGYLRVFLTRGRRVPRYVHHLVLEAFVGPSPCEGADGTHQNDNPSDNRLANLAWETKPKNRGVLSVEAVANIRQRVAAGERQVALAREYGVTKASICLIVNGKRRAAALSGGAR
jgi:NUMOD4 motif/HNH endonuclease